MAWFFGLGITGGALLVLSLVLDGVLDGAFDGALDGVLDGWLSLPVVAGFLAATGFGGVLATEPLDAGPVAAIGCGAVLGAGTAWPTYRCGRALARDRTALAPRGGDLVGTAGRVVTAIPADGFGEVLPQVVAKASDPLSAVEKMTVIRAALGFLTEHQRSGERSFAHPFEW
ncbi:hypothetical protein [Streptomyces stelliscabiei]|uniref:hypothetical protein n=1 Tax=Streptomyces stelliscabiei TaxID=146820 RepID=UPI0029AC732C|nr:hypothetical protein [Streptomyces stelliscabiei]MDX2554289.1 hypothetical protein [Streptomyces stelliscabiei]MDX2609966.1 hypothetical protein [Streptomyces stelliscabiei]MDX2638677.1 hypothetical protein [Streptomyces stelliscabiei]MDX2661830.1 hypothetical protein [Streptomyces stelliscabiei]MDX2712306.1 hypothetical protein [Streptomyces stelliscabiei]